MGALKSRGSSHTSGPVPGTVEIESEHEIATSAAVPGTAMPSATGPRECRRHTEELPTGMVVFDGVDIHVHIDAGRPKGETTAAERGVVRNRQREGDLRQTACGAGHSCQNWSSVEIYVAVLQRVTAGERGHEHHAVESIDSKNALAAEGPVGGRQLLTVNCRLSDRKLEERKAWSRGPG